MENFKKVLRKRIVYGALLNLLAVVFIILTGKYGEITANSSDKISGKINAFQIGFFVGLQLVMLAFLAKYLKAIKNEKELKKLYVEENDERMKLIQDKIGGAGFNFAIGVIATAAIISGFFQQTVFYTLTAVMIFMALLKGFLKLYYRYKF